MAKLVKVCFQGVIFKHVLLKSDFGIIPTFAR